MVVGDGSVVEVGAALGGTVEGREQANESKRMVMMNVRRFMFISRADYSLVAPE